MIIDLKQQCNQMPLRPKHQDNTAFRVGGQRKRWRVMPSGVCNAPATFQRLMDWVLTDIPYACRYINDIIISSTRGRESYWPIITKMLEE